MVDVTYYKIVILHTYEVLRKNITARVLTLDSFYGKIGAMLRITISYYFLRVFIIREHARKMNNMQESCQVGAANENHSH